MNCTAEGAPTFVHSVEKLISWNVDEPIGPGKAESGEEGGVFPKIERSGVEIWMGMSWNFVFVKVIVGFPLNQNCPLVEIKFAHLWWWGEWAEGCVFCKNVRPFISCKSNVRPNMGIVCRGLSKQKSQPDLA